MYEAKNVIHIHEEFKLAIIMLVCVSFSSVLYISLFSSRECFCVCTSPSAGAYELENAENSFVLNRLLLCKKKNSKKKNTQNMFTSQSYFNKNEYEAGWLHVRG